MFSNSVVGKTNTTFVHIKSVIWITHDTNSYSDFTVPLLEMCENLQSWQEKQEKDSERG